MMENNFLPPRIKILLLSDLLFMMFRSVLSFFDMTTSFSKVSSKLANFDMPDAIQWLLRVYCNVYIFVKTVSAASAFFPPTMFLPCPVCAGQLLRFVLQTLTSILQPPLIAHPFFFISEQIINFATIIYFLSPSHYDQHHVGQVDCTASLRAWFIDLWNSNLVNLLRQVRQLCLLDKMNLYCIR